MRGYVNDSVQQISCHKPGHKYIGKFTHQQPKCTEQDGNDEQTRYGGHDQPLCIPGVFMMNAVNDIVKLFNSRIPRYEKVEMVYKSMKCISKRVQLMKANTKISTPLPRLVTTSCRIPVDKSSKVTAI